VSVSASLECDYTQVTFPPGIEAAPCLHNSLGRPENFLYLFKRLYWSRRDRTWI